jgi:hypothetical protein
MWIAPIIPLKRVSEIMNQLCHVQMMYSVTSKPLKLMKIAKKWFRCKKVRNQLFVFYAFIFLKLEKCHFLTWRNLCGSNLQALVGNIFKKNSNRSLLEQLKTCFFANWWFWLRLQMFQIRLILIYTERTMDNFYLEMFFSYYLNFHY